MLVIRGVNVFPSEIEAVLLASPRLAPHYTIVLDSSGPMPELVVVCELAGSAAGAGGGGDADGADADGADADGAELARALRPLVGAPRRLGARHRRGRPGRCPAPKSAKPCASSTARSRPTGAHRSWHCSWTRTIDGGLMTEALLAAAVRTPIGRYGGSLATVRPDDLAALVVREAVARSRPPGRGGRRGRSRVRQPGGRGQPQRRPHGRPTGGLSRLRPRLHREPPLRERPDLGGGRLPDGRLRRRRRRRGRRRRVDDAGSLGARQAGDPLCQAGGDRRLVPRLAFRQRAHAGAGRRPGDAVDGRDGRGSRPSRRHHEAGVRRVRPRVPPTRALPPRRTASSRRSCSPSPPRPASSRRTRGPAPTRASPASPACSRRFVPAASSQRATRAPSTTVQPLSSS